MSPKKHPLKDARRAKRNANTKLKPAGTSPKKTTRTGQGDAPAAGSTSSSTSGASKDGFIAGTASGGATIRTRLPSRRVERVYDQYRKQWRVQAWDGENWRYDYSVYVHDERQARAIQELVRGLPWEEVPRALEEALRLDVLGVPSEVARHEVRRRIRDGRADQVGG